MDLMVLFLFKIMMYLCIANKEEKAPAVKPGLFNFNYWKRTGKADSDISFFYCMAGGKGKSVYLLL